MLHEGTSCRTPANRIDVDGSADARAVAEIAADSRLSRSRARPSDQHLLDAGSLVGASCA
jgi:hypothetical protein